MKTKNPEQLKRKDVERNAALVIKLALPRDPQGRRPNYASGEYQSFFKALEADYGAKPIGLVETKAEGQRTAYAFSGDKIQLGKDVQVMAVSHETGVEILLVVFVAKALASGALTGVLTGAAVGVAKGVATKAATAGVVAFSKWVWNKWDQSRPANKSGKAPLSLVIRKVEERLPDGTIRTVVENEVYGPLDETQVAQHMKTFLKAAR